MVLLTSLTTGLLGYAIARSGSLAGTDIDKQPQPSYGSPEDFQRAITELKEIFGPEEDSPGDLVSTNSDVLHDHGFSTFIYHEGMTSFFFPSVASRKANRQLVGMLHSVVVFPRSTEDVVKVVKIATKYRMPVIPYSGATNLEGHTRGVSINVSFFYGYTRS